MNTHTIENNIYVKNSVIHGSGLFSAVDIPKGQMIMVICGDVISGEECELREAEGNVYIFWNGDNYIDTALTDKIKYINHNCEYNCLVEDRDDNSLYLTAAREIKAGEELTIDYGYEEIYESCTCNVCT